MILSSLTQTFPSPHMQQTKQQGPNARSGTTVRFKPDPEIFKTSTTFEFDRVSGRLDELAYLNAGISITLEDKRCVCVFIALWAVDASCPPVRMCN